MIQTPVRVVGPIGIRTIILERVCESFRGHAHHYDHTTMAVIGRISVQIGTGEPVELGPGETIVVAAEAVHTVKALTDGAKYVCIFSHRDFDGQIVQTYQGNPYAYGHTESYGSGA